MAKWIVLFLSVWTNNLSNSQNVPPNYKCTEWYDRVPAVYI